MGLTPLIAALDNIGYISMVVLGVGFLVFFHELGHFAAAKFCGVRVEAFSIGMGPRLFGWQRGGTDYKFCLLPIGGYVRMYGEFPGEGDPHDPANLNNQSVGARFFIFSGGVIMNLIFALIAFPIVFNAGVPFEAPVVGRMAPGSAAWHARLEPGDRIVAIDGDDVYSQDQVRMEAALAGGDGIHVRVQRGDREFDVRADPRVGPTGLKDIGFVSPLKLDGLVHLIDGDSPARRAGLRDGDRFLEDFGEPLNVQSLRERDRARLNDPTAWETRKRKVVVERDGKQLTFELEPEIRKGSKRLGIMMPTTRIAGIRTSDGKQRALIDSLGLEVGDCITGVYVGDRNHHVADGDAIRALLEGADGPVKLEVLRVARDAKRRGAAPTKVISIPAILTGDGAAALLDCLALSRDDLSGRMEIQRDLAAWKLGLRSGARFLELDKRSVGSFEDIRKIVSKAAGKPMQLTWQPHRDEVDGPPPETKTATIVPREDQLPYYGLAIGQSVTREVYRVKGLMPSLKAGWVSSVNTLRQLYVTLKRILGGSVSADNLAGIITISRVTYSYASEGWTRYLWFLAILSLNFAFINILPIPVLDGGQLMFLTIEKIKGSPVSVRVMTYAQILGVAVVLLLLIFVTFNDIRRLFQG